MQSEKAAARVTVEVSGTGGEGDASVVVMEDAGDGFEPLDALEPPVPEELGVERRAEDGRNGVIEAGREDLVDEIDEVRGVLADTRRGDRGNVGLLVSHVHTGTGDAPVAMTAGPALLVEVEIVLVAGIAGVAGPDLQTGAGVARKDGDGSILFVRPFDKKRMVEAAVVGRREAGAVAVLRAAQKFVGRVDARGLLHEMGVDEEELE
jgi:hypothetical protein